MTTPETPAIRAAIERILDELELRAYLFTLEQKESGWEVLVECATNGEWQTIALPADPADLLACAQDAALRERLREAWRERLRECARGPR